MSRMTRRDVLQSGALLAAGTVLLKPASASASLFSAAVEKAETSELISPVPEIDLGPREHLLFDFGWRFFQGHATDPSKDLNLGAASR